MLLRPARVSIASSLGAVIAPALLIGPALLAGPGLALGVVGLAGILLIGFILPMRVPTMQDQGDVQKRSTGSPGATGNSVFTPAIISLTAFFALLSFSNGAIQNFSVAALVAAMGRRSPRPMPP